MNNMLFVINVNITTKTIEKMQLLLHLLRTDYNAVNSVHANKDGCAFLGLAMKTTEWK